MQLSPPTDSLPKFLAVFGLAIAGGCGYAILDANRTLAEKWRIHFVEYAKLETELERLGGVTTSDSAVLLLHKNEDDPILKEKRRVAIDFAAKHPEFSESWLESAGEHLQLTLEKSYVKKTNFWRYIGTLIGMLIAGFGFYRWFTEESAASSKFE